MLFKLWEPFNSSAMDDRLLELAGSLAEEHVAGLNREEKGGAQWKDVGIWSQTEWNVLIGKGLGSMSMCTTTPFNGFSSFMPFSRCSRGCRTGMSARHAVVLAYSHTSRVFQQPRVTRI